MATFSDQAKKIAERYVKKVKARVRVKKALLFGSAARGEMTKHSDIDLIIISEDFKRLGLAKRLVMLSRLRGREFLDWPMDILGYTPGEFKKLAAISGMFSEAKQQGIEIE